MKKILFMLDTFYPEYASTGQLMTELCEFLQYDFDITVIVGTPQYGIHEEDKYKNGKFYFEKYQNINILRVKTPVVNKNSKLSRLKYICTHFVNVLRGTFKVSKPDYIFTISQPPILGGILGYITKKLRGGYFIYNIQDFNPEQVEAIGYNNIKWINSVARWIDNISIRNADKIILVGRDMIHTIKNRNIKGAIDKVTIINNWIDEKTVVPENGNITNTKYQFYRDKYHTDDNFTIMYSGNIGLFYDLENIIKVIVKFKDYPKLQFLFIGDGAYRKKLEDYCSENSISNVRFYDYVPKDEVQYSLNASDVHLVTNQKGIKGVSVPSKIYGVLAVSKAVIGILESGSEAFHIIEEAQCGKCVEPQSYDEIYDLINWFYTHQEDAIRMGEFGRDYLEKNLKMQDSLDKYKRVFEN